MSSTVGHKSIAPGFKPWLGYVRRVFHLSLHRITFGGHWAHLAYLVHKSGRKTGNMFAVAGWIIQVHHEYTTVITKMLMHTKTSKND